MATPVGTSAIAVVRASGPAAGGLVGAIFLESPLPRAARHADYRNSRGQLLDDVVFTFFAGPNSFTGEDTVEISCHGNPFIAQQILEDLLARGCRPAEAGEFSKRAFLNGRMDLSQAEAVMDLIHARSERALAAANQQLRGALGREMEKLIALLVNALARLEAYIDFPEEDLPEEDRRAVLHDIDVLITLTDRLIATGRYGEILRDGIKVVIIGETNAGKSSLLNRLVGHDRALVSAEPGTTRDYIEERFVLGPHWFRLIDTAGLNAAGTSLEKRGIGKTLEQADTADLFLWVIDHTQPTPLLPPSLSLRMSGANSLAVMNKSDLPAAPVVRDPAIFSTVQISALTGDGIENLTDAVVRLAEGLLPQTGDELIAVNSRHSYALSQAKGLLATARSKLGEMQFSELVASDLRGALDAFGEISGRVDNERILDALFSEFCIGK